MDDRNHQLWHAEIKAFVEPVYLRAQAHERARQDMVVTGFRAAYTLNGGAAIATPTLWEIFSAPLPREAMLQSMSLFIAGILVTAFANFSAHYSADFLTNARFSEAATLQALITKRYFPDAAQLEGFQERARSNERRQDRIGKALHFLAALGLACSAVAFAAGASVLYVPV